MTWFMSHVTNRYAALIYDTDNSFSGNPSVKLTIITCAQTIKLINSICSHFMHSNFRLMTNKNWQFALTPMSHGLTPTSYGLTH